MTQFVPKSYVMVLSRGGWVVSARNDAVPHLHARVFATHRHSFDRAMTIFRMNFPNGVDHLIQGYSGGDLRPLAWDAPEGAGLVRFSQAKFLANDGDIHPLGLIAERQNIAAELVRKARNEPAQAPLPEAAPWVPRTACGHHRRGQACPQHGPVDPVRHAAWVEAEKAKAVAEQRARKAAVRKLREPCSPPEGVAVPLPALTDIIAKLATAKDGKNTDFLTYLGSGIHRSTYAIKNTDLVAKFGISNGGKQANLNEARAYSMLPEAARRVFCPLYALSDDGSVSIMPRLKNVRGATPEIHEVLTQAGVHCRDIDGHNCGEMTDGTLVVFDYGFGVDIHGVHVGEGAQ